MASPAAPDQKHTPTELTTEEVLASQAVLDTSSSSLGAVAVRPEAPVKSEGDHFIASDQALEILRWKELRDPHSLDESFPLCNEDLVGYAGLHSWKPEARQKAVRGFMQFMSVFAEDITGKLGIPAIDVGDKDFHFFGNTDGALQIMFGDDYKDRLGQEHDFSNPLMPTLTYQSSSKRFIPVDGKEAKAFFGRPQFLHFSTQEPVEPLSPDFDQQIRLYLNPRPSATGHVAATICQEYIERRGYMPTGKFMEDALTTREMEFRNDRLLFYVSSPAELTDLLQIVADLHKRNPDTFNNRKPIMTGEPVVVNGQEIPTARLGQEVPNTKTSFNGLMAGMLKTGIFLAFDSTYVDHPTPKDVEIYIEKLREIAPKWGRNPENIWFNAGQDMDVVYGAMAKVS